MGLLTPRRSDGTADPELLHTMERSGAVLLPVFFVVTGLTVDIGGLRGSDFLLLAVVCGLAIAGKIGGGALAARASGLRGHTALVVGVLLNTRGLTELIALNVGWQAGLIDQRLYTILVLMAVVTTAMTGPLLSRMNISTPATSARQS